MHIGPGTVAQGYGTGMGWLSGVLEDAEAAAHAAGITDISCREEKICGGPFCYTQNMCSVPGYDEGFNADLIAKNANVLATELNTLPGSRRGAQGEYFNNPNFDPGRTVLDEADRPAPIPPTAPATPTVPIVAPNQNVAPRDQPGTTPIPTAGTPAITETAKQTAAANGQGAGAGATSFFEQIPPMAWVAIAGVAIFAMSQGGKR